MRYVVVWPAARFFAGGKRVLVTKGNPVPEGVDEALLQGLLISGAIVAASPPADSSGRSAVDDEDEDDLSSRPVKSATVAVWRAYAKSIGITDEQLDGLKKPELIEAVVAAEEAEDEAGTDDEGDDEGEDEESEPAADAG